MELSNKTVGNRFEGQLCEMLSEQGFWAHNMAQNASGQPADVIAVKNHKAYLIDCKVCSGKGFPLSRMEENQDLAMTRWSDCGNGNGFFALQVNGQIFMVSHYVLVGYLKAGHASLSISEISELGMPLDKWVKKCK